MRCPKCGFISFDHLEVCLKCKKDIKVASAALNGGVFHVVSPVFLNLQPEPGESVADEGDFVVDTEDVVEEYVDPDLDMLLEDEPEEVIDEVILEGEEGDDFADLEISMDREDEDEIAIDFGQEEDGGDISLPGSKDAGEGQVLAGQLDSEVENSDSEFEIEMPEELIDMSDLAAPATEEVRGVSSSDSLDLEINLDDFDFELEPDSSGAGESVEIADGGETVLALDDIDFSDTIGSSKKKSPKKVGEMDMDEDLNFDLDLGGLSIHDENL